MKKENFLFLKPGDVVWADGVTYQVISAEDDKRTLRSGQVPHEEITITPEHLLVPSLLPWRRATDIPVETSLHGSPTFEVADMADGDPGKRGEM